MSDEDKNLGADGTLMVPEEGSDSHGSGEHEAAPAAVKHTPDPEQPAPPADVKSSTTQSPDSPEVQSAKKPPSLAELAQTKEADQILAGEAIENAVTIVAHLHTFLRFPISTTIMSNLPAWMSRIIRYCPARSRKYGEATSFFTRECGLILHRSIQEIIRVLSSVESFLRNFKDSRVKIISNIRVPDLFLLQQG